MNQRGQFSIPNLVGTFVTVCMFAILLPVLAAFIAVGVNATDNLTGTVLNLIPAMVALAIVMNIFVLAKPLYERVRGY